MNSGFTKGLLIGGLIGASVSMLVGPEVMKGRNKKRIMRTGRTFMRRSGNIISDVVDMFK